MNQLTFDQVPGALSALIEKVSNMESILINKPSEPTPDQTANDFLTVPQAAAFMSLSIATIYGYIHKKDIPYMKRRGRVYFSRAELQQWIRDGRRMTRDEITQAANAR